MKRTVVLMLVFVMMFVMVAPAPVDAAQANANGTWNDCNFGLVSHSVGPIVVMKIQITQNFLGTLDGKYVGTEFDVVKADGSVVVYGIGIFTGSVAGTRATGIYRYQGIVRADILSQATWVLTGATVAGKGTWTAQYDGDSYACPNGIYSGTYEGSVKVRP